MHYGHNNLQSKPHIFTRRDHEGSKYKTLRNNTIFIKHIRIKHTKKTGSKHIRIKHTKKTGSKHVKISVINMFQKPH